mmetsp:Transcript_13614/g.19473  ORF Transcript_13614/g.19473 Transcript_13614/m.19473 type:complete len:492 (-) Transcript_13614:128-1603(-)
MYYQDQQPISVVQGTPVQATAVPSSFQKQEYSNQQQSQSEPILLQNHVTETGGDYNGFKGTQQPMAYNDLFFALLFYVHLAVMAVVLLFAIGSVNGGENNGYDYTGVIYATVVCAVFAVGMSTLALGFMMRNATELVKLSLFFSILCNFVVGILGVMSGQILMGAVGLLCFAISICYAFAVQSRIPFAAANLNTALTAVKANLGLAVYAYVMLALALVWSVWWNVATGGLMYSYGSGVLFLFLLSFYWTHQVLQNTLHVTTAGTIGTWWFAPNEASSYCSSALTDSFARATTYSFGSICFGSLLVATVQALRTLQNILRDKEDFNFLVCIISCILALIQGIIEYLNQWAYVYVGLYGYSYLEAGKNVMTLFRNKGWSTIITDDLASNVLFMVSVGIGLLTGLVGLILASIDKNIFAGIGYEENVGSVGFIIGLLVGFLLCSVHMSIVASAVNTVIVCYAEAPAEFEQNHPVLSAHMRSAWIEAYPMECANF